MKKYLLLILLLAISVAASRRAFQSGRPNIPLADWPQRVVNNGGAVPSQNTMDAVETHRLRIISDGLITNIIFNGMFVPDSLIAACTPLLTNGCFPLWLNSNFISGDLTVSGLQGDESTKFLDTGFNPQTSSNLFGLNSTNVCLMVMVSNATNQPVTAAAEVAINRTLRQWAIQRGATTSLFGDCWGFSGGDRITGTLASADQAAFFALNRSASNAMTNYIASSSNVFAALVGTGTAQTQTLLPDVSLWVFAFNDDLSPTFLSGHRISYVAVAANMNAAKIQTFYNAINDFRSALGGGNP